MLIKIFCNAILCHDCHNVVFLMVLICLFHYISFRFLIFLHLKLNSSKLSLILSEINYMFSPFRVEEAELILLVGVSIIGSGNGDILPVDSLLIFLFLISGSDSLEEIYSVSFFFPLLVFQFSEFLLSLINSLNSFIMFKAKFLISISSSLDFFNSSISSKGISFLVEFKGVKVLVELFILLP